MDDWMNAYTRRVNGERLARQAPDVRATAMEILEELKSVEQQMYWSLDPDDKGVWLSTLIEHAHNLVDLGHVWRAVLKDNPPPKEIENDEDAA